MIDVGAVASEYLGANLRRLDRDSGGHLAAPLAYRATVAYLAGLHDLGKYSRAFQAQRPDLWPTDLLGPCPGEPVHTSHWRITALLLRADDVLGLWAPLFPQLDPDGLSPIVAAIAGHHGRPPRPEEISALPEDLELPMLAGIADSVCVDAAAQAARSLREVFEPTPMPNMTSRMARRWSWRLSGLITLADWVGSDADFFGPSDAATPLGHYMQQARENAKAALAAKGLIACAPSARPTLAHLAPDRAANARPMQVLADGVKLGEGPQLLVIEDTTGSGKTEAALVLAARLMAAGHGEGVYVALPTMATANAMYARLRSLPERLFATSGGQAPPSMVLAHGKAELSRRLDALQEAQMGDNGGEETTSAYCSDWIADNRRKAFFADVGAGTIDQAFLAVLPKKHLTLRQYALAGRILIVDEAHCFDAYMGEELEAVLTTHAMNGGSAIVLSATLSAEKRQAMEEAFRKGLGNRPEDNEADDFPPHASPYPLLTHVHGGGGGHTAVRFDEGLRRSVMAERLDDRTTGIDAALTAADAGAAVLIICNAVDEAVATFEGLREKRADPERLHLFHARFAQCDRQAIEDAMLERFGRDAGPDKRAGHILVATQVVEQSLDLDFDLIVTDLAPIDLLIQRAGRLWRHMDVRPRETRPIEGPNMLVVSPDPDTVTSDDWLAPALGKATPVYGRGTIMWRSAKVLFDKGAIDVPQDLRTMIETVYERGTQDIPDCLQAVANREIGEQGGHKTLGRHNVIDPLAGYGGLPSDLSDDQDIGTRLGAPTVTVRLARRVDGVLRPWAEVPGADTALAWALSEVRVHKAYWGDRVHPTEDSALHEAARSEWPEWETSVLLVEVAADGEMRLANEGMLYSDKLGLGKTAS